MKKWRSGISGTVVMVLTWTFGWALGYGGFIEAFVDPRGEIEDIWFTVMAIPGLIGGLLFSALLRLAEGPSNFDELPFPRMSLFGVITGLVLGVLAVSVGVAGDPFSAGAAAIVGIAAVLGTVAAIGSALFFRFLAQRQLRSAGGPRA